MQRIALSIALGVALFFILCAVLAGLALSRFTPDEYRDDIAHHLSLQIGRPVRIDGPVQGFYFPWLGLEARSIFVPKVDGSGPLLTVGSIRLRVRLLPLLRKELVMDRVVVVEPEVHFRRDATGKSDWENLLRQTEARLHAMSEPTPPDTGWLSVRQIVFSGLTVRGGTLHWQDEYLGHSFDARQIQLKTGTGDSFPYQVTMRVTENSSGFNAFLQAKGVAHVDMVRPSLILEETRLQARLQTNFPAGLATAVLDGRFRLDSGAGTFHLEEARLKSPGLQLEGRASGTISPEATLTGETSFSVPEPKRWLEPAGPLPRTLAPLATSFSGRTDFALSKKNLVLSRLKFTLLDTPFAGQLRVASGKSPRGSISVRTGPLEVARFLSSLSLFSGVEAGTSSILSSGTVDLSLHGKAEGKTISALAATLSAKGKVKMEGVTLLLPPRASPRGEAKAEPQQIDIPSGEVKGVVSLDLDQGEARVRQIEATGPGGVLRGHASLKGLFAPTGNMTMAGAIESSSLLPREVLQHVGAALPWAMNASALRKGEFLASFKGDRQGIALEDLSLELDGDRLAGEASWQWGQPGLRPFLRFDLESESVNLDRYLPLGNRTGANGAGQDWDLRFLTGLDFQGRLRMETLRAGKLNYGGVTARLEGAGGVLNATSDARDFYTGEADARLGLDTRDIPTFSAKALFQGFGLRPALLDMFGEKNFAGRTTVRLALESEGRNRKAHVGSLHGSVSVRIRDGFYRVFTNGGRGKPRQEKAQGTLGNTPDKTREQPRTIFNKAEADFTIQQGIISNKNFTLRGPLVKVNGEGNASLPDNEVEYRLVMQTTAVPSLVMRIHGPLDDPAVDVEGGRVVLDTVKRIGGSVFDLFKNILLLPFTILEGLGEISKGEGK